ncbi:MULTISPECIES: hypothetical protein [Prosthecochloris]|uniref:Uncharacterized protein n=1 Tax=Prosthecochloris marina TaxID=2017681 RepID=A0A317TAM4_9CHLB|nr:MULTISPECIES: hypothetical protein [Prosthecochloris]PWW82696.1 hypothetical protein CR164_02820 [Prosthecochloris marina]UZJ38016.1 hypothetical protein OO005_02100 [Prosthecochloris sp. SCSIO W1103]
MEQGAQPFDFGRKVDPNTFEKLIQDGYEVDPSKYLKEGWEVFKSRPGEFIVFSVIIFVVIGLFSRLDFIGPLATTAVISPLYAGFIVVIFMLFKGREVQFGDFFKGFNYFLPLVLAGIVSGILVGIGFALLLLPGIYLAVSYMFVSMLIVDYRMEFWQAMETSRQIVTKNWFSLFVFFLLLFVVNLLGVLALGIGLLVTIPLSICSVCVAYRDIVGLHEAGELTT